MALRVGGHRAPFDHILPSNTLGRIRALLDVTFRNDSCGTIGLCEVGQHPYSVNTPTTLRQHGKILGTVLMQSATLRPGKRAATDAFNRADADDSE